MPSCQSRRIPSSDRRNFPRGCLGTQLVGCTVRRRGRRGYNQVYCSRECMLEGTVGVSHKRRPVGWLLP
eukprot:scaffold9530_cov222-Alexandrium_tamarense.AAC.3